MRFAYADPPYLGQCDRYGHVHEVRWMAEQSWDDLWPNGPVACWDNPATHRLLIEKLVDDYPDGWALSASSPSLQTLLPMCPWGVRVTAWVKPFAAFKANVRNAYTWEPVIVCGGRLRSKDGAPVTRDHVTTEDEPDEPDAFRHSITLKKGLTGAKPPAFCEWVLKQLGYKTGDSVDDIFPGTGVMGDVLAQLRLAV